MFELEIMVTGYTVLVATTSAVICKYVSRKRLKKYNHELTSLRKAISDKDIEIKQLKYELVSKQNSG